MRIVEQGTILLMVSIGSLILLLALLILFHENANATKGYRLRTLERERSKLLLEQEVVQMQVAEVRALENLRKDKRIQLMVVPKGQRYIIEEGSTVAER